MRVRTVRNFFYSILLVCLVVVSIGYVALNVPYVQHKLVQYALEILEERTKAKVDIKSAHFELFNRIILKDISILDQRDDTIFAASRLAANVDAFALLRKQLIINTVQLYNFDLRLSKLTPDDPLNIQFIIDSLQSKEKKAIKFDNIELRALILRKGRLSYDLYSALPNRGGFDPNHILIDKLQLDVALHHLTVDSLDAEVKKMAFSEHSGFEVEHLSLNLEAHKDKATIKQFRLSLPNSKLLFYNIFADYSGVDGGVAALMADSSKKALDKLLFNVELAPSKLYLPDIKSFVPLTKFLPLNAQVQMAVNGTPDSIRIKEVSVLIDRQLDFLLKGEILHPSDLNRLDVDVSVDKLNGSSQLVYNILAALLPANKTDFYPLTALGDVQSSCKVIGSYSNLIADGSIQTAIGSVAFNGQMRNDSITDIMKVNMSLNSTPFNIQKLLADVPLTEVDTKIAMNFAIRKDKLLNATFDAFFDKIEYLGFSYGGLHLNGVYNRGKLESSVEMKNANGNILLSTTLSGLENGKEYSCLLDFKALDINISPFLKNGVEPMIVSGNATIDLIGSANEIPLGTALFNDIHLDWGGRVWNMDHLNYISERIDNENRMKIISPLIKGYMNGNINMHTIMDDLKEVVRDYLSIVFPINTTPDLQVKRKPYANMDALAENVFDFAFTISNTEALCETLKIPYAIVETTALRGSFSSEERFVEFNLYAPLIKLPTLYLETVAMDVTNIYGDGLFCSVRADVPTAEDTWNLSVDAAANNNVVSTTVEWNNKGKLHFAGKMNGNSTLSLDPKGQLAVTTDFNPTNLFIGDSTWQFNKSTVVASKEMVDIRGFGVVKRDQSLIINGAISPLPTDSLSVYLNNIDIDNIFSIVNLKSVTFGGIANGVVTVSSLTDVPRLNIDGLNVNRFSLNYVELGELEVSSNWDHEKQGIVLDGVVQRNGDKTSVHGLILPIADSLSIEVDSKNLNSAFLDFWLGGILNNISGDVSGGLRIYGKGEDVTLAGVLNTDRLNFTVPFINANFTLADTIKFTPDKISFTNAVVTDKYGNQGRLSGGLTHDFLQNIRFNIHLQAEELAVFDVKQNREDFYYGTIFATGMADIYGDEKLVNIDVKARSTQDSKFTFMLPDVKTADDYSFVTFVSPQRKRLIEHMIDTVPIRVKTPTKRRRVVPKEEQPETIMNVNILMDVNPDAALSMVLDQSTGDVIQCTGGGNITLGYNSVDDEIKLFGTYTIDRGSYGFSFQNIFNRDFAISSGSTVSLSGDPMSAVMNINAVYNVSANLLDLNRSFSDVNRTTVPVQCLLNINGTVDHPSLGFDLNLPNNTDDVNRRVKNVIGSDDMMNRQIIYLMLLGRFYTVDYTNMSGANSGELTSAVLSSTVSALFGNILTELSPNWKIGANYRLNSLGNFQDAEVALSSQLLNNRLLFNGNFGYREDLQSQASFIGDFDLEYILNDAGTLSVKAYNKTNEKNYYIKNSLTTQGIGIVYKKNFSTLKEMFNERLFDPQQKAKKDSVKMRKKADKRARKERESVVQQQDSTNNISK